MGDEDNSYKPVKGDKDNSYKPVKGDKDNSYKPVKGDEDNSYKPGDVLYGNLEQSKLANHYGVYIGDGKVIDFSKKGVKQKPLKEFENGRKVHVKRYDTASVTSLNILFDVCLAFPIHGPQTT